MLALFPLELSPYLHSELSKLHLTFVADGKPHATCHLAVCSKLGLWSPRCLPGGGGCADSRLIGLTGLIGLYSGWHSFVFRVLSHDFTSAGGERCKSLRVREARLQIYHIIALVKLLGLRRVQGLFSAHGRVWGSFNFRWVWEGKKSRF